MNRTFIKIPLYTTINEIVDKDYTLSATQHKTFDSPNKNCLFLNDFLDEKLSSEYLGSEVGSDSYVYESEYKFLKTKSLQEDTYLLSNEIDAFEYINPKSYIEMNLKKGDLIISKDSNVGEIAILDRDYENCMLCSGIYKLPITKNKMYVLAFIKSDIFRQQIDFLVPRGSTIRHGKTKFLECKIPMPNRNVSNTIKYVETLMEAIINKEVEIRNKYNRCSNIIANELENECLNNDFKYCLPKISDIEENERMDTKIYSERFRYINHIITNYKNGCFYIDKDNIKGGNTPKSRYISYGDDLDYYWVTPTLFSDIGLLTKKETINCSNNNINRNCLLIVNRTSKGEDGLYVGMSYFYNVKYNGKGHNNQGIYRVINYDDETLYYLNALINSRYYREYFGMLSMGSKMKEIKLKQVYETPFPKFDNSVKNKILALYHTNEEHSYSGSDFKDFIRYDTEFNKKSGIYNIDISMKKLKARLNQAIENITEDIDVEIEF